MEIRIIRIEQLNPALERWWIQLPRAGFRDFGFLLETLEGTGLHKRSREAENLMEVDVAVGMKTELEALISALQVNPDF